MALKSFLVSIPQKLVPRVEKAITDAATAIRDGSEQEYEAVAQELAKIQQETGKDVTKALADEIREELLRRWRAAGLAESEFVDFARPRLIKIFRMAENLRKQYESGANKGKHSGTNLTAKLHGVRSFPPALGAVVVGVLIFAYATGKHEAEQLHVGLQNLERQISLDDSMRQIYVSTSDFQRLADRLSPPAVDAAPSPEAAAPLPMAIAAVAAEPVKVEISDSSGGVIVRRTLPAAEVYEALPEPAQEEMEQQIVPCRREHNSSINVTSTVGTARISGFFGKSGNDC